MCSPAQRCTERGESDLCSEAAGLRHGMRGNGSQATHPRDPGRDMLHVNASLVPSASACAPREGYPFPHTVPVDCLQQQTADGRVQGTAERET